MIKFERIRNLREDKDLSQAEVAKALNISQRAYSHYENGERTISPEILIALAKFHNTSTDYLLGLSNKK
ncbi:MAG: helix-turn-helix transcriptional regulator [Pseudobutyrivibrio sp.]|nr:helix-turn-helix transcriptional regulator [Pseudobutyrivibrio sp.]